MKFKKVKTDKSVYEQPNLGLIVCLNHKLCSCTTNLIEAGIVVCNMLHLDEGHYWAPPGVLGIWGEWLFIFRELGSTGDYLRGSREQANNFGDIGSLAKKQKI